MKVDVWFGPDNKAIVTAEGMFRMEGTTEDVIAALKQSIKSAEDILEASKVALARILYSPMSWG